MIDGLKNKRKIIRFTLAKQQKKVNFFERLKTVSISKDYF